MPKEGLTKPRVELPLFVESEAVEGKISIEALYGKGQETELSSSTGNNTQLEQLAIGNGAAQVNKFRRVDVVVGRFRERPDGSGGDGPRRESQGIRCIGSAFAGNKFRKRHAALSLAATREVDVFEGVARCIVCRENAGRGDARRDIAKR